MKPRTETPVAPAPAPVPAAQAAVATSARLRAVVVDDEPPAREELIHLLAGIPAVEVIGEAANGVEAVALIEEKRPDLAFLDIRMPGLDGFQVVRHLSRRQLIPQIVFVTAFDQYAIRAFEVSATDYLLKPIEKKRLTAAIDKVKGRIGKVEAPLNLEMLLGAIAARRGEFRSNARRAAPRWPKSISRLSGASTLPIRPFTLSIAAVSRFFSIGFSR